jgi:ABC-type multidrug transport system ATPase subunit
MGVVSLLRLGRAPDNDIVLDAPGVSRHHATIDYSRDHSPVLADVGSLNGTFVNGAILRGPRVLGPEDLVSIGGFIVQVHGREVHPVDLSASRLCAHHLSREVDPQLKDVSLAILPREFVALIGPSGCGKSTLLKALNGLQPATNGNVSVGSLDLYDNFRTLRRAIGYVPQKDALHETLTVKRTLVYAARLRLPEDTPEAEVQRRTREVAEQVELECDLQKQFKQLSGGEQKRLSIAIELLTRPNFLFLDEPTSPLDPEKATALVEFLRGLADQGQIVVMVTHRFEGFEQMHQVAVLAKGGRLAFFGPPADVLRYFKCQQPGDIYKTLSRPADKLRQEFIDSAEYQRHVDRITQATWVNNLVSSTGRPSAPRQPFSTRQWAVLTQRYLETKQKDRWNTLLLLLQAPVIALILGALTAGTTNDVRTLFIAGVMAIWFGANNSVREIVAELPLYERERLVALKIPSYALAKFVVLSGFALVQCILFLAILIWLDRLRIGDSLPLLGILYLTSLGGISIGLFVSALVSSTEKAMSMLPLILIPQLLLSGFLKPLDDVYVDARTGRPASAAAYEQFAGQGPAPNPVKKSSGLGTLRYASTAIIARWTLDGLVHAVSLDDDSARSRLPTQVTVRGYRHVLAGSPEATVHADYRAQMLRDVSMLGAFSIVFLALTLVALHHKDPL